MSKKKEVRVSVPRFQAEAIRDRAKGERLSVSEYMAQCVSTEIDRQISRLTMGTDIPGDDLVTGPETNASKPSTPRGKLTPWGGAPLDVVNLYMSYDTELQQRVEGLMGTTRPGGRLQGLISSAIDSALLPPAPDMNTHDT